MSLLTQGYGSFKICSYMEKIMNQEQHEMVLEMTHASGAEEWYCPTCGRRMTITWEPWKRIILEPGDIHAVHKGSTSSSLIESLNIGPSNEDNSLSTDLSMEDPRLDPWKRWLDKQDADDL
jgi:hypothetical protein